MNGKSRRERDWKRRICGVGSSLRISFALRLSSLALSFSLSLQEQENTFTLMKPVPLLALLHCFLFCLARMRIHSFVYVRECVCVCVCGKLQQKFTPSIFRACIHNYRVNRFSYVGGINSFSLYEKYTDGIGLVLWFAIEGNRFEWDPFINWISWGTPDKNFLLNSIKDSVFRSVAHSAALQQNSE